MVHIIVRNYSHINSSMPGWDCPKGKIVKSKAHYENLCKEYGMVSYEQAQELAENGRQAKIKNYKVSKESLDIIQSAKQSKDSRGNVKLSDRAIDALIQKKAIGKKIPEYMKLPAAYNKGGFV